MVSPPRRATHAAAAEAGPACARPPPAHEAPAAQPAYWLAQRAAPADLASRPRTAPRAPPAVGQRLLDARCMLPLLPPPRDPSASGECPHELLIVSGLSPSIQRNQAFGPPRGLCPSHSALRTPPPRVPPPGRVYSPVTSVYPQNTPIFVDASIALCSLRPLARLVHPSTHVCGHVYRSRTLSPWTACTAL